MATTVVVVAVAAGAAEAALDRLTLGKK